MFEKKRETPERLYYMRILGLCNWTIKSSLHDFTLPRCPDTPTDHIMLYHIISPAYVYAFFASCHNSTYTSTSYYLKNPPERAVSAIKLDRSGSIFKPGMICVKCWRAKKPRPFRPQRTLRVNEYEIRPIHLFKQQINRENVNRVDVVKKKKKKIIWENALFTAHYSRINSHSTVRRFCDWRCHQAVPDCTWTCRNARSGSLKSHIAIFKIRKRKKETK